MRLNRVIKAFWGLFILIILSFWSIKPFFMPGFFPMHDDTQVSRIFEMGKALKGGMFPVRWSNDLGYGYGYPLFNFYAPLSYYYGGILTLFGINSLLATKITMITGIILSGIFMYFLARIFWSETGGLISALFYLYASYHAVDIYVRGDLAESWAYAFIPLLFLGVYKVFVKTEEKNKLEIFKYVVLGSIGYAGIILSHNLSALMVTIFFTPFFIVLVYFSKRKIIASFFLFLIPFLALFLSAFYWLPVPFELNYTNVVSQIGKTADYHDHFVCLSQLWYSPWGFGGSVPGCIDGLSFALGKIYILLSVLSVFGIIIFWKKNKTIAVTILTGFIGWIFSLFLTTEYSRFFWEIIKPMSFLQYPWRFLAFAAFFSSFISGGVIFTLKYLLKNKYLIYAVTGLFILALLFFQVKFFLPQRVLNVTSDYYTSNQALNWRVSKISDEYLPKEFIKPKSSNEVVQSAFQINPAAGEFIVSNERTQEKKAKIKSAEDKQLILGLSYFPAWHSYIDNLSEPVREAQGKIEVFLPKGIHTLTLSYRETMVEKTGDFLSLTSLIGIFIGIIILLNFYEKEKSRNHGSSL